MQYFTPGNNQFLGDCMPFWDGDAFHLYYLLDEGHHQGLGGLGGHQWAHASTRDLRHWEHHPLALPVSADWEGSICTGSVVLHEGVYHAFYATRKRDWTQHLSHAVSDDGITFTKTTPNPFMSPPAGYGDKDFRDPFVFAGSDGRWHMLVTSRLTDFPLHERGGCLLHLVSDDLWNWHVRKPLLIPGGRPGYACVPECPDYFEWNGWHYLLFGLGLGTHYRMARSLDGPWLRPANDILDSHFCAVMKTAQFGRDRRIGAGWAGPRRDNRDEGGMLWGGNVVFRELVQNPDGTLATRFAPELTPPTGPQLERTPVGLTAGCRVEAGLVRLDGLASQEVAVIADVPRDARIQCRVVPQANSFRFGLGLRGQGRYEAAYELAFSSYSGTFTLANIANAGVKPFEQPFDLDIAMVDDIIDVCVDGRRCLVNRLPEQDGPSLFLFCENGVVVFESISIHSVISSDGRDSSS